MTHYQVVLVDGTTLDFEADRCRREEDTVLLECRTGEPARPWTVVCEVHYGNLHRIDPLDFVVNPLETE